jgi:hypothetical protein
LTPFRKNLKLDIFDSPAINGVLPKHRTSFHRFPKKTPGGGLIMKPNWWVVDRLTELQTRISSKVFSAELVGGFFFLHLPFCLIRLGNSGLAKPVTSN